MKFTRRGSVAWQGSVREGGGELTTGSGALSAHPFGFGSRFLAAKGTNPEELIAAAHAGCFSMTLALLLGEAGLTAERLDTSADVTLEQVDGGYAITSIHLTLRARVPGADAAAFAVLADRAKAGCPVSKLVRANVTLDVALVP